MQARTTNLIDGRRIVHPAVSYQLAIASIDAAKAEALRERERHDGTTHPDEAAPLFEAIGLVDLGKL